MKKAIIFIVGLLICAVLVQGTRFLTLPNMQNSVVYKDSVYIPLSGNYYTAHDECVKKAVGRFDDAIVYTLRNDPDEFYLYPKVFLPHMKYVLYGRQDALPIPNAENVDRILLRIPEGFLHYAGSNAHMAELDEKTSDTILKLLEGSGELLTDKWVSELNSETYDVLFYFHKPDGLIYQTKVVKYGEKYGLLLADGKTLIAIDNTFFEEVTQSLE